MAAPQKTKSKARFLVWMAVVVAVPFGLWAIMLAIGALAFSSASTSLTRKDFATEASARAFVDEHLPVALPTGVSVRKLTYERFTDWHLETDVEFGSSTDVEAYLRQAHATRQLNLKYCGGTVEGDADVGDTVSYYLAKFSACGSVARGPQPTQLRIECYTR